MTMFKANERLGLVNPSDLVSSSSTRVVITTRTSWMANNATPDSINMNVICRSLLPPVDSEPNGPNIARILNTIKPVTMAFTTMDAIEAVRTSSNPQGKDKISPFPIIDAPDAASQVARGDKLKSAYQMKIYSLT